jgi:hypothetical protein
MPRCGSGTHSKATSSLRRRISCRHTSTAHLLDEGQHEAVPTHPGLGGLAPGQEVHGKATPCVVVGLQPESELLRVLLAGRAKGRLAGALDGWQQ